MSYILECAKATYTTLRVPGQFLYDMETVMSGAVSNTSLINCTTPERSVHYTLIQRAIRQLREDQSNLAGADIHSIHTSWSMGRETYARLGNASPGDFLGPSVTPGSTASIRNEGPAHQPHRYRRRDHGDLSPENALSLLDSTTELVGEDAVNVLKAFYTHGCVLESACTKQRALQKKLGHHTKKKNVRKIEQYTHELEVASTVTEEARSALFALFDKDMARLYHLQKERYTSMCSEILQALHCSLESPPSPTRSGNRVDSRASAVAATHNDADGGATVIISVSSRIPLDHPSQRCVPSPSSSLQRAGEQEEEFNMMPHIITAGTDSNENSQHITATATTTATTAPASTVKERASPITSEQSGEQGHSTSAATITSTMGAAQRPEGLADAPNDDTVAVLVSEEVNGKLHTLVDKISGNRKSKATVISSAAEEATAKMEVWFRYFFFDRLKNSTEKLVLAYALYLDYVQRIARKSGYILPDNIRDDIRELRDSLRSILSSRRHREFSELLTGIHGYRKNIEQLRASMRLMKEAEAKVAKYTGTGNKKSLAKWTELRDTQSKEVEELKKDVFVHGADSVYSFYDDLLQFINQYIQDFHSVLTGKHTSDPGYAYYSSKRAIA